MTGQQLYADSISANMFIPSQVQGFTFSTPVSQYQIFNLFIPTSKCPSQNILEFINNNDAGYRLRQLTANATALGNLILESFTMGNLPGMPILTFNENGPLVVSLTGNNAFQLKNNTNVTPLEFYNASGTNYVAFQAGSLNTNTTWTLPLTDSTGTQALVSNGSGILSWQTILAGTVTSVSGTTNRITVINGTTTPVIDISASYVGQSSITTLGTITTGTWNAGIIPLAYGGSNANLTAVNAGVVYSTASTMAISAAPSVSNEILMGQVAGAPVWSGATYPSNVLPGQLLYGSGLFAISGLATAANGVLVTDASDIPSISSTLPIAVQTNITELGTIIVGAWNGSIIDLAHGGTNANLTPSAGGIVYSTASALAILSGTATANQILLSGSSAAPVWSTAIYPTTSTINQLLYSSSANVISGLTTANNSILLTNGSGVPAWQTLTSSVVTSITGTANQITASSSSGAVILSMPANVIITTSVTAGNLELITNTLQSNNTNGNIIITPNGTGIISLSNNVGIGTTTPNSPLQFASSVNNRIITLFEGANNPYQYYGFGIQNSTLVYEVPALTNFHVFYAGTSSSTSKELLRISAGGNGNTGIVGINQPTPLAGLHVVGGVQNVSGEDSVIRAESSSNSAKIELDCTNGTGRLYEIRSTNTGTLDIVDRTGSAEKVIINTNGVGIGATAPTYLLDVFGTARASKLIGNANAPTIVLGAAGVVGTGATASIIGSELGGVFTLNTGTGTLGAGTVATFTLTSAMPSSTFSVVFFSATTAISTAIYVAATSSTVFVLSVNATFSGLNASTTYKWNYQIVGY